VEHSHYTISCSVHHRLLCEFLAGPERASRSGCLLARSLKTFDVPGISVAIVKDGKIVLAKGYGVRKLGESTSVDEHTMFGIGSNTKAFTAAALATLVDEGKISWDDPVYQRLPGFVMYDPYVSHEMTIRDLLTRRRFAGLSCHHLHARGNYLQVALYETAIEFPQPLCL
jgi:CubicO group peptidase (beta-lactamase class C family)